MSPCERAASQDVSYRQTKQKQVCEEETQSGSAVSHPLSAEMQMKQQWMQFILATIVVPTDPLEHRAPGGGKRFVLHE